MRKGSSDMTNENDERMKRTHKLDQTLAMFRDEVAPTLFAYYQALIATGFTEEQAMDLTCDFHSSLIHKSLSG